MMLRACLALCVALLAAMPARADELRPGYLELTETRPLQWRVVWKAPIRGGLAARARPALPADCQWSGETRDVVNAALVVTAEARCGEPLAGREIGLSGLDDTFTDALVRIAALGKPVQAARLTANRTHVAVDRTASRWEVARTYFVLGVEHILFGFDHLLFVLSLVLLLRRGRTIAKAVTAFTVAHSITLIGSTLGFLGLPQRPVESVIALSIMFLAVEIVKAGQGERRLSERWPWIVAFTFGLLHGFGFAGALAEIGLPQGEVPAALLSFNLGVEAGQLLIVGAGLAVLAFVSRVAMQALRPATLASAYAIGTIASFWFIDRTLG